MRRFQITSTKFTGIAEIIYNTDEILCKIDCSDTDMSAATIRGFKTALPATISELAEFSKLPSISQILECTYRIPFDDFWKAYNKKINKGRVIPLYAKLTDADTVACLNGIKVYDKFLAQVVVRQKLDPENYIKNRAWENEYK